MLLFPAEPSLDVAKSAAARAAASGVVDFRLDNGLTVVVIPTTGRRSSPTWFGTATARPTTRRASRASPISSNT